MNSIVDQHEVQKKERIEIPLYATKKNAKTEIREKYNLPEGVWEPLEKAIDDMLDSSQLYDILWKHLWEKNINERGYKNKASKFGLKVQHPNNPNISIKVMSYNLGNPKPPKGKQILDDNSDKKTAIREFEEETGIKIEESLKNTFLNSEEIPDRGGYFTLRVTEKQYNEMAQMLRDRHNKKDYSDISSETTSIYFKKYLKYKKKYLELQKSIQK
jgi:hypothetical protein